MRRGYKPERYEKQQGQPKALDLPDVLEALLRNSNDVNVGVDKQALPAVDVALRLDEAVETVQELIARIFAGSDDLEDAQMQAMAGYEKVANSWPAERRQVMDREFADELALQIQRWEKENDSRSAELRKQRLQERLQSAVRRCVEQAREGDTDGLGKRLQRAMLLRDVCVAAGVLDVDGAKALSDGFAVDLACAQVRGEIRRMAEHDPINALQQALEFVPDVPEVVVPRLQREAKQEAAACLRQSLRRMRAERRQGNMRYRVAAIQYLGGLIASYSLGQPVEDSGDAFAHDPEVQEFRKVIDEAASRRGLYGDDPFTVQVLSAAMEQPLPRYLFAVMRAAAAGRVSWQSAVTLCGNGVARQMTAN